MDGKFNNKQNIFDIVYETKPAQILNFQIYGRRSGYQRRRAYIKTTTIGTWSILSSCSDLLKVL